MEEEDGEEELDEGDETRGDKGAHGFWKSGVTCIFDVRVIQTDAPSYRGRDPDSILAMHEGLKKDRYLEPCLERRRHFTRLVYSVDGMAGVEAQAAEKRLASHLAKRWQREYSEMVGYVRTRMSIAIARAVTLCLREPRDKRGRIRRKPDYEDGAGCSLLETMRV